MAVTAVTGTNWDENILASAVGIPAVYDAFASSGGIADGVTNIGFSVEFTWIGESQGPNSQSFEIYNPNKFDLLETGTTSSAVVPVPSALILMASGLLCFGVHVKSNGRRNNA